MNTDSQLSLTDPLMTRLRAWQKERFPLPGVLLGASLFMVAVLTGRFTANPETTALAPIDLLGALAAAGLLLLLRVLDEHKDYEDDVINFPQRILQSGLITLNHLKVLGLTGALLGVAASLIADQGLGEALLFQGIMLFWVGLMTVEFFCPDWLKQHLTLYAVSHTVVMPLIAFWFIKVGGGYIGGTALAPLLALLFFIGGFSFEITRKTKGPEEEQSGVDSYSKKFGSKGAAMLVLLLMIIMLANQLWLLTLVTGANILYYAIPVVATGLLAVWSILSYYQAPSTNGRKKNEATVGLAMLIGLWTLSAAYIVN